MSNQIIRTFTIDELENRYGLPWNNFVHDEEVGERRWVRVHRGVFLADDGHHYAVEWDEPKSESQQDSVTPFPDYLDAIDAVRVEKHHRTVVIDEWLPVAAVSSGAEEASKA